MDFTVYCPKFYFDPVDDREQIEALKKEGFVFEVMKSGWKEGELYLEGSAVTLKDVDDLGDLQALSRRHNDCSLVVDFKQRNITLYLSSIE